MLGIVGGAAYKVLRIVHRGFPIVVGLFAVVSVNSIILSLSNALDHAMDTSSTVFCVLIMIIRLT